MLLCANAADFEIHENTRADPDNYTYTCGEHLAQMLGTTEGFPPCNSWTVEELGEEVKQNWQGK